jgi:hypothetical protein
MCLSSLILSLIGKSFIFTKTYGWMLAYEGYCLQAKL